jgi:hypothetical protein
VLGTEGHYQSSCTEGPLIERSRRPCRPAPPHVSRKSRDAPVVRTGLSRSALLGAVLTTGILLTACGSSNPAAVTGPRTVSVFKLHPSQCLTPPKSNPNLQVSTVTVVPCTQSHTEEVYCVLPYSPSPPGGIPRCPASPPRLGGNLTENYPGDKALETFANAMCLDEFQPYVGTPYKDSSLYYSYLYPSPRSWDDPTRRDRMVACVLVTTGAPLTRSAKGSRL